MDTAGKDSHLDAGKTADHQFSGVGRHRRQRKVRQVGVGEADGILDLIDQAAES